MKSPRDVLHFIALPTAAKMPITAIAAFLTATVEATALLSWAALAIILLPVFEIFQWLSDLLFL